MILDQQRQIDELRAAMAGQAKADQSAAAAAPAATPTRGIGEIASTTAILPTLPAATALASPLPAPQAAVASPTDAVQKAIDAINGNLRGFRLSGDFRLRFDTLNRSANTGLPPSDNRAIPQQRDRERYRVRFNVDKDLFYKDGADRSLATFHLQLATDPFNNPTQWIRICRLCFWGSDFNARPIWISPTKSLTHGRKGPPALRRQPAVCV